MGIKERFDILLLTKEQKAEIENYYLKYHAEEIYEPSFSEFSEFSRTGERLTYENHYFERRRRINSVFMMCKIHGNKYINELCALLDAVCSERSWALPAHIDDINKAYDVIDLFAAETAMMLAEIVYLIGDILPEKLCGRIFSELQNRIFIPYVKNRYHWEEAGHNWSAVCVGAIGIAYLCADIDNLPLERILKSMDAYISGYNDDGVCLEGASYWSYGFGFYMYFAHELLCKKGIDIINKPKVRKIAEFYRNITLRPGVFISCSDAQVSLDVPSGLLGLLGCHFSIPPVSDVFTPSDDCGRWAHYIRSYLYPPMNAVLPVEGEKIFETSQWYINRKKRYSFFIKGGKNNEPHNHNDIGSFIIADDGGELLCDIGAGVYTQDYFSGEMRYGYLCASSLGHSVPIIDGRAQNVGEEYRCESFTATKDGVQLSFGAAYDARREGIKAVRRVTLFEKSAALCDSFEFDDDKQHIIYERFVTKIKPEIRDGKIVIGNLLLRKTGTVTEKKIRNHDGEILNVYLIDIPSGKEFRIEFEFI